MDFNAFNFDWGLFEGPATTSSNEQPAWECNNSEKVSDYSFTVSRYFSSLGGNAQRISDMDVYKAACSLSNACSDSSDVFHLLSCINLLNAAIKTPEWKDKLSYADIKSRAADLFTQCIRDAEEFPDVHCYYSRDERCAYMKVYGVLFSFHNIRTNDDIDAYCSSSRNQRLRWEGIRLQMMAPKVVELAEEKANTPEIPAYRLESMKEKFQEGAPRLYNRFRPRPAFSADGARRVSFI